MDENATGRVSQVIGPEGLVMTLASLPSRNTRWVARRKAEIVVAVHGGVLTMAEAHERYAISADEFMEWERAYEKGGLPGLRRRQTNSAKSERTHGPR